jgi:hypothetical protein
MSVCMKDSEVIAHQARQLAELEKKFEQSVDSERQLLGILRASGIEVTQVELNRQEAEFIDHYRRATPEGKAAIRAKVEAMAASARLSRASDQTRSNEPESRGASKDILERPPKVRARVGASSAPRFSDLPIGFFKSSPE